MKAKKAMPVSKAKTAYGLLSEIRKLILEEPRCYDQSSWKRAAGELPEEMAPPCGTVCCVAGWVDALKSPRPLRARNAEDVVRVDGDYEMKFAYQARTILGLTVSESEKLFDGDAAGSRSRFDYAFGEYVPLLETHAKRGAAHIAKFQQKYAKRLKAKRV
jgi:hypothetical protein